MKSIKALALSLLFLFPLMGKSQNNRLSAFEALDVFELEWASDPQIAPDASQVVYRRNGFDIMSDHELNVVPSFSNCLHLFHADHLYEQGLLQNFRARQRQDDQVPLA